MDGAANELDIADDIEASGYFSLNVLNNGVYARVSESPLLSDAARLPPRYNLFSISNVFGWAVAATQDGFSLINLSELRTQYLAAKQRTTIDVPVTRNISIGHGGLTFLRFGMADKTVIASGPALQGGIAIWRLKSLVEGSTTAPEHVFPQAADSQLLDVLPNPGDRPELLALLYQNGQVVMLNLDTKATVTQFGGSVTAACWSVKGKQIVCGDSAGALTQYTPEGQPKTLTEAPSSLRDRSMSAVDIRWVENTIFFVTYVDPANPMDTQIFVSTRQKSGQVDYAPILDPLMVENMDRPEARFNVWLKSWAPFRHLLVVSNTTSNTISHVGQAPIEEGGSDVVWSQVKNDLYTTLPLETFPLGLELDLGATEAPSSEENAGDVATPILWSYATDGTLSAWRVVNKQGGAYPAIISASDIVTQEDAGVPVSTAASAPMSGMQMPRPPASASPSAIASTSPFGTPGAKPGFGATSFGSGTFSSPPAFGSSSAFGKTPFAPAFGQSTFGPAPSPSASPAFGQPAFGKASTPAFGQSAAPSGGGFASFSSSKPAASAFAAPSTDASTSNSPFASSSTSSATTPAFAASQPAAFGTSTFGNTTATSSSGFSFASTAKKDGSPSPFSISAKASPQEEKPSPFASSATPAEASTATKPAFGASTGFGTASTSGTSSPFGSAFGKPASGSGFGSFATDSSKPASGSGSASFGKPSSNSTGFSFGGNSTSTSATPSTGFGSSGFGGLRDQTSSENAEAAAASKPTGLDDSDADHLEPEQVSDQRGGALDFGSSAPKATHRSSLSMSGLAFGSSAKTEDDKAKNASPFGNFGQVATTVKKIEERAATETSASPPKPPASFLRSPNNSPKVDTKKEETYEQQKPKSAFGFAGFGGPLAEAAQKSEDKDAGAVELTLSFAKPSTDSSKAPAFGSSAFGKPSGFGASPSASGFSFGKSSAESTKESTQKSAFSAFASSSGSTSPFGSPSGSKASTPFGQPGFFSSFGEKPKPKESPDTAVEPPKSAFPKAQDPSPASQGLSLSDAAYPEKSREAEETGVRGADDEGSAGGEQEVESEGEGEGEGEEEEEEEELEDEEGEDYGEEDEEEEDEEEEDEEEYDDEEDYEHVSGDLDETGPTDEEAESTQQEGNVARESVTPPPEDSAAEEPESPESPTPAAPSSRPASKIAGTAEAQSSSFGSAASAPKTEPSQAESSPFGFPASSSSSPFSLNLGKTETAKSATPSFGFPTSPATPVASPAAAQDEKTPGLPTFGSSATFPGFAAKPAASAADASKEAPKPVLNFAAPQPRHPESSKPFGFANLQKAAPRTSSPLAALPSFAPPASPAKAAPLATPPVEPSKSTPPAFGFASAAEPVSRPSSASAAILSQQPSTPKPAKFPSPGQTSQAGQGNATALPPKLSSTPVKGKTSAKPDKDEVKVFITMQEQLVALRDSVGECQAFLHSVQPARLPPVKDGSEDNALEYEASSWSMGDLPRMKKVLETLHESLTGVAKRAEQQEKETKALEGSLLKTKAKSEEIARYLKARDDPALAKIVKMRQLGPEQQETQRRLRRSQQSVEEAIEQLERALINLKDKMLDRKLGRSPMKAPSLDTIHRSSRNITNALQQKNFELDDLALRLDMATISMMDGSDKRTPKKPTSRNRTDSDGSFDKSVSKSAPDSPLKLSPRLQAEVDSRVQAASRSAAFRQALKAAWLEEGRTKPLMSSV